MLRTLWRQTFEDGYISSRLNSRSGNYMAAGSENVVMGGDGKPRCFRNFGAISGTPAGSKVMMNVGDDYGGLGAYNETGVGSIFRVLGAWFFIGAGSLYKNGVDTSADASTTLQIKKVTSGSLGTTYQAGLAQPSAPIIAAVSPPTGFTGKNNGVVSVRIARVRSATGARSNASLSSNVVQATNQSIAITFPSADANGQDYWEIDVTLNGQGALGNHYFLQEVPETLIAGTVVANATTDADTTIGVPNGTLTSAHIGWQYTSAGDTTTYVTAVGANDSHSAGKQTITLNAASVLTTTQSATFTRAIDGTTRTFVVEWKDADIVGSTLAPIRDYPPPAGIFGGVLGDVVFVDGALGDTVDVTQYAIDTGGSRANTTTTFRGNAIAVSDPAKPESFPPDNYIFTNDPPTALLPGGQGMYWRFAKNSLGVIRYVGRSPAVTYERLWTGVGIQNQHNCVLGAGGRLYAFTGKRGLVRLGMNGEPDSTFVAAVEDDFAGFVPSDVVLGYDANNQFVTVSYAEKTWAFHEPSEKWGAPCGGGSTIDAIATVTFNGALYLADLNASSIGLVEFDGGISATSRFVTPWVESVGAFDIISRLQISARTTGSQQSIATIQINGDTATNVFGGEVSNPAATRYWHWPVMKPNVRGAKSYRVTAIIIPVNSGDAGVESVRLDGETSEIAF